MSHKTLRRFHGYDYSRGGSMFVTTGLAERTPLFGRVDHERVVLSEAGYTKDCFSLDKILVYGKERVGFYSVEMKLKQFLISTGKRYAQHILSCTTVSTQGQAEKRRRF